MTKPDSRATSRLPTSPSWRRKYRMPPFAGKYDEDGGTNHTDHLAAASSGTYGGLRAPRATAAICVRRPGDVPMLLVCVYPALVIVGGVVNWIRSVAFTTIYTPGIDSDSNDVLSVSLGRSGCIQSSVLCLYTCLNFAGILETLNIYFKLATQSFT